MAKTALALRHVHFEDLGVFAPVLAARGYEVRIIDAPLADLTTIGAPDLLIVLGGPVGVDDVETYRFLGHELAILHERLTAGLPTLGLCLGAQLMAAALGAKVRPMGVKEIGFAPVSLTQAGRASPLSRLEDVPVLHWHGDMFEIPSDAVRLAGTEICPNQAYSIGTHALGLQFHAEADCLAIESWLVGHASELAAASVDPVALRAEARRHAAVLESAGQAMLNDWLDGLAP
ncbi:glutamine amidotransferase [Caulobacter sp. RHG1]|uniref:glutamine amidotransferase n=1 Tax=Caulobacter sp. (strain RHG1) TaxID=2545762 RepID=UPI0015534A47|nr:glutamine amidotransferase [Caulobacter sp. RHG1]NQE61348.1 Glutamine amidotransferase, class I [Caulobacter sp. RHG1]